MFEYKSGEIKIYTLSKFFARLEYDFILTLEMRK